MTNSVLTGLRESVAATGDPALKFAIEGNPFPWNGITLGLSAQQTSLWDLTESSNIAKCKDGVKEKLNQNDGRPWKGGITD